MPALDRNLSILVGNFCVMIARLNIMEGHSFRVEMSILNGAEKIPRRIAKGISGLSTMIIGFAVGATP